MSPQLSPPPRSVPAISPAAVPAVLITHLRDNQRCCPGEDVKSKYQNSKLCLLKSADRAPYHYDEVITRHFGTGSSSFKGRLCCLGTIETSIMGSSCAYSRAKGALKAQLKFHLTKGGGGERLNAVCKVYHASLYTS